LVDVIQITEIESLWSHVERMDRRPILPWPMEHNMNTRKDEFSSPRNTVELALVELDEVSGGRRPIEGELKYLNWVKQFYSPWANVTFGGRTAIA
jgi:hypothetical protein